MEKTIIDETYKIEGHLNIRVVYEQDEWYYGFLDDGMNISREDEITSEKMVQTPLYLVPKEYTNILNAYMFNSNEIDGNNLLNLVCGEKKYILQEKEQKANSSGVVLTFIGQKDGTYTKSLNRITIDNGDKKTGVRDGFALDSVEDNILVINSISTDDKPLFLEEYELLEVEGPKTYNYPYSCAVKVKDSIGEAYFIMNGSNERYDTWFNKISCVKDGFVFTNVSDGATIFGNIGPEGLENALITTHKYINCGFATPIPIKRLKGFAQSTITNNDGVFRLNTCVDGIAVEYSGILDLYNQAVGSLKVTLQSDVPIDNRENLLMDNDFISNRIQYTRYFDLIEKVPKLSSFIVNNTSNGQRVYINGKPLPYETLDNGYVVVYQSDDSVAVFNNGIFVALIEQKNLDRGKALTFNMLINGKVYAFKGSRYLDKGDDLISKLHGVVENEHLSIDIEKDTTLDQIIEKIEAAILASKKSQFKKKKTSNQSEI